MTMPTQSRPGAGRSTKKKAPASAGLQPAAKRRVDGAAGNRGDGAAQNTETAAQDEATSSGMPASEVTASNLERREIPSFSISREARIAEAAYWRAERRGFSSGQELDDWLAAEKEVDDDKGGNRQP
jgi:Protein of unknown function (DUF2934)